jgi:hypothetical protein
MAQFVKTVIQAVIRVVLVLSMRKRLTLLMVPWQAYAMGLAK